MSEVYGPVRPDDLDKEEPRAKNRTAKRRLKYADGHMDLFRTGGADDPMSVSFIPLEERTELERARLFARGKKPNQKHVEYD
jgi:hypothetical protein